MELKDTTFLNLLECIMQIYFEYLPLGPQKVSGFWSPCASPQTYDQKPETFFGALKLNWQIFTLGHQATPPASADYFLCQSAN